MDFFIAGMSFIFAFLLAELSRNLFKAIKIQKNKTVIFIQPLAPTNQLAVRVVYKKQGGVEWKTYNTTVASMLTCKSLNFELAMQELLTRWHKDEFYSEDLQVRDFSLKGNRTLSVRIVDSLAGVKYPSTQDATKGLVNDYKRSQSTK